jgi:hypothetical protein
MKEDQFTQLLAQMTKLTEAVEGQGERLDKIEERLGRLEVSVADLRLDTAQLKVDVRLVYRSLETLLHQQDVETEERVHLSNVVERHERWITGLAKQANLKLSHD